MDNKYDEIDPIYTTEPVSDTLENPINSPTIDEVALNEKDSSTFADSLNQEVLSKEMDKNKDPNYDDYITNFENIEPLSDDSENIARKEHTYDTSINSDSGAPRNKNRKRKFPRMVAVFLLFAFLGGIVFGAGYGTALYVGDQLTPSLVKTTSNEVSFNVKRYDTLEATQTSLEDSDLEYTSIIPTIAKYAGPSVVTITSQLEVTSQGLFGSTTYETEGSGSGILYDLNDTSLLIITNHHVIDGSKDVEVTFYDGTSLSADVIGYNSRMDLAVLSIPLADIDSSELEDITIATFGSSEDLEVGELAVAIGNPLGKEFASTVTAGVISAVNRELTIDGTTLTLLQTDAAINPGNSGGALVDHNGYVIGINTAKYVDESVEGMGFSIPVHLALPIIEEIIAGEGGDAAYVISDDKPFLGIQMTDITEAIYNETGIPYGVYIVNVVEGSAADEAGIKSGDIIYSIDDTKIQSSDDLFDYLSDHVVGDTLKIKLARGDDFVAVEATLTSYGDVNN